MRIMCGLPYRAGYEDVYPVLYRDATIDGMGWHIARIFGDDAAAYRYAQAVANFLGCEWDIEEY